ncbi:unnamed protein product [Notodromas monacha]|uniref:Carboxylesterase type B domain-containing protein n=1 Tax=Notodromas monacha TaxID=399045 RepID=A0A7R9GGX0_9CRUS|nr:unnamed protein product [Notodromas monacha]CAG0922293.1 unnamed protein product [Notodromas monacha]
MILVTQLFGCPNNGVTRPQFGGLGIGKAKDCPGWRLDQPALDYQQLFTDIFFGFGAYASALLHSKYSKAPAFLYSWDHCNQGAIRLVDFLNLMYTANLQFFINTNWNQRKIRIKSGRSHGDDIALLLNPFNSQPLTPADKAVKNLVSSLLISFATSTLSTDSSPQANGIEWQRFDANSRILLTFSENPSTRSVDYSKEYELLLAEWYEDYHTTPNGRQPGVPLLKDLMGI